MGKKRVNNNNRGSYIYKNTEEKRIRDTESWYQLVALEGLAMLNMKLTQDFLDRTTRLVKLKSSNQEVLQIQPRKYGKFDEKGNFTLSLARNEWVYIYSETQCFPYSTIMNDIRKIRIIEKIGK